MTKPAASPTADTPLSAATPRLARSLFHALLFLLACAAGCAVLGKIAPFPDVPGIYPKWSYFREHRDRIDVLFLGSSRFYHQIIPAQFEAAAGSHLRSFNFGYDGMWPPESFYLLRQLLAMRPAKLKWVVIDLMDINTQIDDRNNSTLRTAYWHDLRHTALAFHNILDSAFHPSQKAGFLLQHASLCGARMMNLGSGADLLQTRLNPRPARRRPYTWADTAGFEAGPDRELEGKVREGYLATVERLKASLPPQPVRPIFRQALREIIADVRRAGAEPIFVIAPTLNARENFTDIPDGAAVIALNDPNQHPELFDPAKHYDGWHLNPRGAIDFTAILARKFLEHREEKQ